VPRVEPNHAGIAAMCRSPMIIDALHDRAERIQTRAAQISAAEAVDTGLYAASWRVAAYVAGGRAVAKVFNTARSEDKAPYPYFLEVGWRTRNGRHVPAKRILARSLDAARI
jgi:hypothetical protein